MFMGIETQPSITAPQTSLPELFILTEVLNSDIILNLKLPLCLVKQHTMEMYRRVVAAPGILDDSTRK
jgi:hypothetical protein